MFKELKVTSADVVKAWRLLPLSFWLAEKDIKARYARTVLGPFWSVLSIVFFVGALAITFGALFGISLREFLPYLSASIAVWNTISSILNESTTIFQRSAGTISTFNLPLSVYINKNVIEKFILLLHFLTVYMVVAFIFPPGLGWSLLLFVPALFVLFIFGIGAGYLFGAIGIRYRDITPAMASLMLLSFLITPIFWQKSPELEWLVNANPFYHLLEIARGPLLGYPPEPLNWIIASGVALGTLLVGFLVFSLSRRSIFYWL